MTMFTFFTTVCRHKLSICFHTRVCFAKLRQIPDNMIFICIQNLRICIMQQKSTAQAVLHVELEGIEPSSKQGNHTLSTRLFRPSVFVPPQDPDHQRRPYLQKFHHVRGARHDYSRFNRTAYSERFGTTASGRCLVLSPCDGIKPVIYYASIRQRERICFRQINL